MITAYDWMNPASEQNNFQKNSGEFQGARSDKKSLFLSKNLRE